MRLSSLAAMSALLLAAQARPAESRPARPGPNGPSIAGLSGQWRPALTGAFRAFSRERNPRPDCFSVHAYVQGSALLVNFTPGRPLASDAHLRGGSTSCGREVSFLMSRDGRLLRRTYSR
jgi:hypothetical protein